MHPFTEMVIDRLEPFTNEENNHDKDAFHTGNFSINERCLKLQWLLSKSGESLHLTKRGLEKNSNHNANAPVYWNDKIQISSFHKWRK